MKVFAHPYTIYIICRLQCGRTLISKSRPLCPLFKLNHGSAYDPRLTEEQLGFRAKYSTKTALTHVVDSWLKAVNVGKLIGCVLVDFQKPFYLVDHQILLRKVQCYKCEETCLKWFESYLTNRIQRVSLNSHLSETAHVTCGVPQGSISDPFTLIT